MKHSSEELRNIPLTETILQSCYKSKTFVRNGEWHILWHLGGKNNVTIGEKSKDSIPFQEGMRSDVEILKEIDESAEFFYLPAICDKEQTVTDLLPKGLVHCQTTSCNAQPLLLKTVGDLEEVFPELTDTIKRGKFRL